MSHSPIVIVSGARTPIGGFQGTLSALSAPELGAHVIAETLKRAGVAPQEIEEVIMGCVLSAGLKQGPARQAALKAGLPDSAGCTTVNKLCGSGMKATMFAYDQIRAGSREIVIAGGMESMTNAPYVLPKVRAGLRMGHGAVLDHMFCDGLEDAETGRLMGSFAQDTADKKGLTRQQMDDFAIASLKRAQEATSNGAFAAEIAPITIQTAKGSIEVSIDEQPTKANFEKIPQLKPAFSKEGTITAANSSSISDGAAALLLMPESLAVQKGLKPLARILGHSTKSQHPSQFTTAPIGAIQTLLDKVQWSLDQVDLWEINEAFAMVTLMPMLDLGIPHEKVNIHGGACALGHPIGATGTRIILTLIHALKRYQQKRGVATLCIGGGEATAVAVEII